jgi:hypothetical protein
LCLRKFDPFVAEIFDPTIAVIFDPAVATIFDPVAAMIFDHVVNNKFDRGVSKNVRPPRQDSSTPAEPKTSPNTLRPLGANASTTSLTGKTD